MGSQKKELLKRGQFTCTEFTGLSLEDGCSPEGSLKKGLLYFNLLYFNLFIYSEVLEIQKYPLYMSNNEITMYMYI